MKNQPNKFMPGSPHEWLTCAKGNLALARLRITNKDVLPELARFHSQPPVEKSLKAVFLHHNIHFTLIHDLEMLVEIARHEGLTLPAGAELGSWFDTLSKEID